MVTNLTTEPDEALALCATQDIAAFEELIRRYRLAVYRYHIAWTGNEQEAQSLTTQTFLAALDRITAYQFGGPFLRWFFGIASQLRRYHVPGRAGMPRQEAASVLAGNAVAPDHAAGFQAGFAEIARVMEALREDVAEAVLLRIFAGFSSSEVGLIMLKSDTAVKALVYDGLLGLSERLAWNLEVEDD